MRHSLTAVALGASLLLMGAQAQATTITFDDLAAGTTLAAQYAAQGVTFSANAFTGAGTSTSGQNWADNTDMTVVSLTGGDSDNPGTPSLVSGNVLGSYAGWLAEDGDGSFKMTFSTPVTSVSADFASVFTGADVRMYAYNGSTLVGEVSGSTYGQFLLGLTAQSITSVVITPGSYDDYVSVDNISFTQAVPEPANIAMIALGLGLVALRRRNSIADAK